MSPSLFLSLYLYLSLFLSNTTKLVDSPGPLHPFYTHILNVVLLYTGCSQLCLIIIFCLFLLTCFFSHFVICSVFIYIYIFLQFYYILIFCSIFIPIICFLDISLSLSLSLSVSLPLYLSHIKLSKHLLLIFLLWNFVQIIHWAIVTTELNRTSIKHLYYPEKTTCYFLNHKSCTFCNNTCNPS